MGILKPPADPDRMATCIAMPDMRVALVTPSYRGDALLCEQLCRSIQEFAQFACHYIVVDRHDLSWFRHLSGPRTVLLVSEEILPRQFVRLPGWGRWISGSTVRPASGWLMQQIKKIACATLLEEEVLVLIDSDTCLVRPVEVDNLVNGGRVAFYARPDGITREMGSHLLWYRNACRLLGVQPLSAPLPDYISSVVPWESSVVRAMLEHVETVTGSAWWKAVARTPQFSEYLLYGTFVDRVLMTTPSLRRDERDHLLAHWDLHPLEPAQVETFVGQFREGDFACLISSQSGTSLDVRRQVLQALGLDTAL